MDGAAGAGAEQHLQQQSTIDFQALVVVARLGSRSRSRSSWAAAAGPGQRVGSCSGCCSAGVLLAQAVNADPAAGGAVTVQCRLCDPLTFSPLHCTPTAPLLQEGMWQWVDIWNCLYRERIIFLSKPVDEELGNQVRQGRGAVAAIPGRAGAVVPGRAVTAVPGRDGAVVPGRAVAVINGRLCWWLPTCGAGAGRRGGLQPCNVGWGAGQPGEAGVHQLGEAPGCSMSVAPRGRASA